MMQFDNATGDNAAVIEDLGCVLVLNQRGDRYRPRGGTQRRTNRRHEGIDTALNVVMRMGAGKPDRVDRICENGKGSFRSCMYPRGKIDGVKG